MLLKLFCIICIISVFYSVSDGAATRELSEKNLLRLLNSQLCELRTEQDVILKAVTSQNCPRKHENQTDSQSLTTKFDALRAEVDSIKIQLDAQKKDAHSKDIQIELLKTDLLRQKANVESLKADVERLTYKPSKKEEPLSKPTSCDEAKTSGIFDVVIPNFSSQPVKVVCNAQISGGRWTVILRRFNGSQDFFKSWSLYKNGFGDLNGEFFMGLNKIHAITSKSRQELMIVLEDIRGSKATETYDNFSIGNEAQKYNLLSLGEASGNASDALINHLDANFSTFDRDNDDSPRNCAVESYGAWWYHKDCHHSNLAGKYNDNSYGRGVIWSTFRSHRESLKKVLMMIRTH